jgi:uncharacterized protein with HEPN domain
MSIPPNIKKHLYDLLAASQSIQAYTGSLQKSDYLARDMVQAAVERKLEIIGEALNRIGREDEEYLHQIPNYRRIIGFRNILAHGYDVIDQEIVWDVVQNHLPALQEVVMRLMDESS